ncbi:putative bifunctional diguanylate cyclase/phosphodiesterase [Klenkia brasiliensis]|uniref:Diguanylate cyclase (GGDEF) domain-containing protein n=1 Tax=Klenkia brasiliensis TaxID=333142 RepID=A0A1G7XYU2_9ACTN|nr:EAL domain-containing protein [Klenkia brasiliensis]SDG89311.1 diguanylate cyclase (GGDEF) domain-containing protein [Klenkia brasiliensis]
MTSWLAGWRTGSSLAAPEWEARHRWITRAALAQAVCLALLTGALDHGRGAAGLVLLATGLPAALATRATWPSRLRTVLATLSLTTGAALLVPVTGQGESFSWMLLAIAACALYQDWAIVPTAVVVAVVDFAIVVFGPAELDLYDLLPVVATLLVCLVHHRTWQLAEDTARTDPLTGLGNRRRLAEATGRMLRAGGPLSVLFCDLDGFKGVNDSRGHHFGDQLLAEVAGRLGAGVRSGDLVVRLGGDEFAVLVPGPAVHAADVARRLQTAMRVPVQLTGRPVTVTASIGVATTATATGRDAEELLRNADVAMYQAKATGRNRVVTFAPGMAEAVLDRVELAEDLTAAMAAGDQLSLHYQPVVTLPDGRVHGHEALLRWRHPTRGPVPPLKFVPIAEQTGAIGALGAWVLHRAVADAAAGLADGSGPSRVAVNVSAVQLADEGFVDVVAAALAASGLPAHLLVLEVTESVLADDVDAVCARLQAVRDLGVRIAIDDFGTGYSSLSYLRRLPVDIVKIDRSFVTDLARGGSATTLVASILELARSLSLDVVAEGVETPVQQVALAELGCSFAQGYLFGRPAPLDTAARALQLD